MKKLLLSLFLLFCFVTFLHAQYLPTAGGTMTGNINFSASNLQIQAPYYGFNYGAPQPSTSGNISIFTNNNTSTVDYVGWSNGWRFVPTNSSSYPAPVVTFSPTGNVAIGSATNGLPAGNSALILRGPNSPASGLGYQDINYSFNGVGSARIRAYRGSSWDTYLQFLVNKVGQGSDAPTVAMHIDQTGNIGIGTTNVGNKLQIADGADDATPYGTLQIIRTTNPGDNKFHLCFVRSGQMYSGIGYVNGTNTLGIWGGGNTSATPTIAFTQGQYEGIGTSNPQAQLAVKGTIYCTRLKVTPLTNTTDWPDYVFADDYQLRSLDSVESYVKTNKHLPEIPSAQEVVNNGLDVADHQKVMLQKIEELTLYIIQQQKALKAITDKVTALEKESKSK